MLSFTDVTLRDGLQAEKTLVDNANKRKLFQLIEATNPQRIEVTSFVSPKWIPQFADVEPFLNEIGKVKSTQIPWMVFVPNLKGLERAVAFPVQWISCFVAASETFNQKNVNRSIDQTLDELKEVVAESHRQKRLCRIYISTVFGCPYEGDLEAKRVEQLLSRVVALGPDEIALSDTIGVGAPSQIKRVIEALIRIYPKEKIALHLHNTYGLAVAAAYEAFQCGVTQFDGSASGIGGCPYAKGATGNVAMEDLRYAFFRAGIVSDLNQPAYENLSKELRKLGLTPKSVLQEIRQRGGDIYGGR